MMDCDVDKAGHEIEMVVQGSEDDDDEFGQKLPPLHVYVKRVLDKYPEGGQILKELLQNADDAGASEIIFLHDKTQHPTDHLWSQSLQKFNGPALYVYNDATFKDSDWTNIQHPEQSGKHDDPTKVGRFGLGFISVYHITDMPSIFSSRYIGFLDPNEKCFKTDPVTGVVEKGKRGKKWRISQKLLQPGLKDQFSPYLDPIFKCNEETFKNGYYNGTIFRFPFRADEDSKISHSVYDEARVQSLFQSFQRDAEISLLFLKNVMSVAVYEKRTQDEPANLVFKVEVSPDDKRDLQLERSRFLKDCQKEVAADGVSRCRANITQVGLVGAEQNNITQMIPLQVPLEQPKTSRDEYLIVNVLKRTGLSQGMQDLLKDKDLKQLPWVGLAMKIASAVGTSGRMFCFLPLPENERSHLPVHVHGYFGLGDNRRSIKWPDQESQHDNAAQWNIKLVEEVFPEAYVQLIMMAIERGIPALSVYKMWPDVSSLTGPWEDGVKLVIKELGVHSALYTKMNGGSWQQPKDVFIDTEQNGLLHKILLKKERPVVHVPKNVLEALRWAEIQFQEVTPALVRKAVRGDPLQWLDRQEKMQLLEYILRDNRFSDLDNIHLLPRQDESFVPFTTTVRQPIYIPSTEVPRHLFPNMETLLTADDCPDILKKAESFTQLSNLTVEMVPQLLRGCLPTEWREGKTTVTWGPGLAGEPTGDWLEKFWHWLDQTDISLSRFASLPLIQIGSSTRNHESTDEEHRKKRKITSDTFQLARLEKNRLIFQRNEKEPSSTQLPESVCLFLESLDAIVVRTDLPKFIATHREIDNFIQSANGDGVMSIIEAVPLGNVVSQVSNGQEHLRPDLVTLLSSVYITVKRKRLLRKLPLFKASSGEYVCVDKCANSVHRDYFSIPLQKVNRVYILQDNKTTFAQKLGVDQETLEHFLQTCVLPSVESHFYNSEECCDIMKWVLERGNLDCLVKSVKFLPTFDSSYSRPGELFDPENSLLTALYSKKPVFPVGEYAEGRLLLHIRRIGLKQESSIQAEEILKIALEVSKSHDRERSFALLDYICKYPACLSQLVKYRNKMMFFGNCLKNIPWVACETCAPPSYPACLPWNDTPKIFNSPSEVKLLQHAVLLGSSTPLVKVSNYKDHLSKYFGWSKATRSIPITGVLQHLQNMAKVAISGQSELEMSEAVTSIYKFLAEVPDQTQLKQHFSVGGIMSNTSWVWQGKGFTTPDLVAFNSRISQEPYLHKIPVTFHKFRGVLLQLGVRESFTTDDYVGVLEKVKLSRKENRLNEEEHKLIKDILEAITADGCDLETYHDQLYVLDYKSVLRPIDKVIYNDDEYTSTNDGVEEFIDVHHSLTSHQARLLGVRNRREIQLDRCSTDLGFEHPFGQTEKLTTRLSGILREYSHTPDVLKELLQNADDAGASEIHVVYDPRKHKGKRIAGPEWKPMHNAPALCVYNDKPFTDEDIKGIQNVGVGGKISDATTTGRFGIGFNSVYHLTDCPTFLTQNTSKLCIFDPHVKYVPRATTTNPGKLYRQDGPRGCKVAFPDMIEGYLCSFGEFDLKKGTMFRFPLREGGMESEISDKCYTRESVETLLTDFERTSKNALLFLNHVQKISISEIQPETGRLQLRYSVSAEMSGSDKKQRLDVSAHLQEKYKDGVPSSALPQLNRVYRMHVTELQNHGAANRRKEEWLVSQTVGLDQSQDSIRVNSEVREFKSKSFIPRGGVAAPLNCCLNAGNAFCFLPLPIDTGLPVHVNGTFALDQSRQNLKKGDGSMIHRWNQVLAEHVIAPAYAFLLEVAGKILYQSEVNRQYTNGMWRCKQFDDLFPPNLAKFSDVWEVIAMSTLKFIGNNKMKIMPVVRSTGDSFSEVQWFSPDQSESNAFFDDLSTLDDNGVSRFNTQSQESKARIMRLFLQRTKFNLISCSGHICRAFQRVKVNASFVSPTVCCQHVKVTERIARSLPCDVRDTEFQSTQCLTIVLKYCLNGLHEAQGLLSMPFQLDGKCTLSTFSCSNAKYISYDNRLLPAKQELFLHTEVVSAIDDWNESNRSRHLTLTKVRQCGVGRYFGVRALANHIDSVLPPSWKGSKNHISWQHSMDDHPNVSWLQMLWRFLCQCRMDDELHALEDWPIIPTTEGKLVSLKMGKTVLLLYGYNDTQKRCKESSALQSLGCPVVDVTRLTGEDQCGLQDICSLLQECRYLAYPINLKDVLSVLEYMIHQQKIDLTGRLTHSKCDTLLWYFATTPPSSDVSIIKHLPIFPVAGSQNRRSIHQFEYCYTQSEPLIIPGTNCQAWMEGKGYMFLEYRNDLASLYERLRIRCFGVSDICTQLVLPNLHELPQVTAILYIKHIRDFVLPRATMESREKLHNALKGIKFIPGEDGELREAGYFFNTYIAIFAELIESEKLLPTEFCTEEWLDFLISIGLQNEVTGDICVHFAEQVEEDTQRDMTEEQCETLKRKSFLLLNEIKIKASAYKIQSFHTLERISNIRFIPLVMIDEERKQIHAQFASPGHNYQSKFICYRGSVPEAHRDLVWSVASLLPTLAIPHEKHIKQSLGIEIKPTISKVLQHVRNVCNEMAKHNAYDKEDTLAVRPTLVKVVANLMLHLKKQLEKHKEEIQRGLKDSPICLVDDNAVLVKASQLVFDIPKDTENQLKPYIYKAPYDLAQYKEVLQALGAQEEATFDQLAMVLEGIQCECKDKKMMGNERKKAHCATSCLFRLLQSTAGQCPISVTRLYLPTSVDKLAVSTTLYYTDLSEAEAKELPCSPNTEYLVPLKQLLSLDETEAKLIQLLPQHLQPKKMATHEKPLETNIPCGASQCPLVSQIQAMLNSSDTQEVLLRLIKHQTQEGSGSAQKETSLDAKQRENVAKLRDFNSFICVQELKTGFFNNNVQLISERNLPREVFLVKTGDSATLYFSHTDVSDHIESGANFFNPLAKSINNICELNLDALHIQYLSQVLPLPSITSKNTFLTNCGIPEYDNSADTQSTSQDRPGSIVPHDILFLLDDNMSNKFNPGDIAVYKQHHEDGGISYVYAEILERLPLTEDTTEESSLLRQYKIDIGEHSPKIVSVVELFMFRRPKDDADESSELREVAISESSSSSASSGSSRRRSRRGGRGSNQEKTGLDIETVKTQIQREVQEAMKLPETQRKECLRRLYRMWHPDKNPDCVELATKAFQFLKQEIERASNQPSGSFGHNFSQWDGDIARDCDEEQSYQREFRQHSRTRSGKTSGRTQFFPESFTNRRPDNRKAKLWCRQAEEDFNTAKQYGTQDTVISQAWTSLMIQQSAEKALKALIFYSDGTSNFSHNLSILVTVACQHSPVKEKETQLRGLINQLVQLRCDAIRSRYPEDGTNRTTGEAYQDFGVHQALCTCQTLLNIVKEILPN